MNAPIYVLFSVLLSAAYAQGQPPAREIAKKRPRDVETVVRMKYFRPIRLEQMTVNVPDLMPINKALSSENLELPHDEYMTLDVDENRDEADIDTANKSDIFWSPWSDWTECSRSCGGGVSSRSRNCISRFSTSAFDMECDGQSIEYTLCNNQECPEGSQDFRAKQCSDHDDELYYSSKYKWIPFSGPEGSTCELQCVAKDFSVYHTTYRSFGPAHDGTKCGDRGKSVCINGECMNVGCDGVIGSDAVNDMCGVCGGNNSTCNLIRDNVNRLDDLTPIYHEIAKIPAGATNVRVKDYNKNHLALFEVSDDGTEVSVVNGDWIINFPGEYKASGEIVRYNRIGVKETIEIEGPTKKLLRLMILPNRKQPLVEFQYWRPIDPNSRHRGSWMPRETVLQIPDEESNRNMIKNAGFAWDEVKPPTLAPKSATTTTTTHAPTTTISTTMAPPTQEPRRRPTTKPSQCTTYKKAASKKKLFCDSDFVVHVRVLPMRRIERRRFVRYAVEIMHSYKRNVRLSRREYIWIPAACSQRLRFYRHYLILGTRVKTENKKPVNNANNQISSRPRSAETILVANYLDFWYAFRKNAIKTEKFAQRIKCRRNRYSASHFYKRKHNEG